jgi:hypothetical protein
MDNTHMKVPIIIVIMRKVKAMEHHLTPFGIAEIKRD